MISVLIADDNAANRELLCVVLESAGFTVTEAKDGIDALEKLEVLTFDVALLDIRMPRMDGVELLQNIRRQDRHMSMPVAAVSASAMSPDEEWAKSVGFDAYLTKPYEAPQVLALVRRLVGRHE
jgi:CheY-like chemotaxis protein